MSHTTTLGGIQIKDIAALKKAVEELQSSGVKCSLVENQKARMWYAEQSPVCEYVLQLPNIRFDVGLKQQPDGTFAPMFDDHGGIVRGQIGAACAVPADRTEAAQHSIGKLMQGYAKHAAINEARRKGMMVKSASTNSEGKVILKLAV